MSGDARWLAALLRKYLVLRELRTARAVAERARLRELAAEFPGALRELDCLPLATIDERVAALQRALADGSVEPWMRWVNEYHRRLRVALAIKQTPIGAPVALECDWTPSADWISQVSAPPGGRLNPIIFADLAAIFAVPAQTIEALLFPKRRSGSMFRLD